jgi:hypothetical protein
MFDTDENQLVRDIRLENIILFLEEILIIDLRDSSRVNLKKCNHIVRATAESEKSSENDTKSGVFRPHSEMFHVKHFCRNTIARVF